MKREDVAGLEFDWFALDRDGHIAIFSTAGWGEIPTAVLEASAADGDDSDAEAALIERMPRIGEWRSEGKGPGGCREWTDLGMRGLYVFDWRHWSGPYERIVVPATPAHLSDVPKDLQARFTLVRMEAVCFADTTQTVVEGQAGRVQERAAQQ
jgi:hypothetical protein